MVFRLTIGDSAGETPVTWERWKFGNISPPDSVWSYDHDGLQPAVCKNIGPILITCNADRHCPVHAVGVEADLPLHQSTIPMQMFWSTSVPYIINFKYYCICVWFDSVSLHRAFIEQYFCFFLSLGKLWREHDSFSMKLPLFLLLGRWF